MKFTPMIASDSRIHYGVSWYPEMWPDAEWEADADRMAEVGFTLVRLFEFAWKRFEPREGVFEFDWAIRILDLLHARGIRVMIGTPTAAPPAWVTDSYPEVLGTRADRTRHTHGKRKHYNPHSRVYRTLCRRIVARMAEELGPHPAVHSWQIDNEMSGFDYGDETRDAFHVWLEHEYGTVDHLNRVWGLDFWSQAYDRFDQVPLATANVGSREQPERHHPSLIMAIARFQNQGWTTFMEEQMEEIRSRSDAPVTTNMTGFLGAMDWSRHFRDMDRAGASMYADLNYYHYNFIRMDRLRAEKNAPYWLLETAPNWSGGGPVWNIHHDERGICAFTWLSMLMGGSMVLYWQWRSHWAGQEMQHGTCVNQNGQWMPGKAAWTRMAAEFTRHGSWLLQHPAARGPVGIVVDSENAWYNSIDPIDPANRYADRVRDEIQMPLVRRHFHREVLHPEAEFDVYRVLIVPWMARLPGETRERLAAWVKRGGRLLLGPHTGVRTGECTLWIGSEYGGLEELIGARQALRFSPHWVEDSIRVAFDDGAGCHPRFWCEAFTPDGDTEVWARYRGGYGDGLPAVVARDYGRGRVVTLGTSLDEDTWMHVFTRLARGAGVVPHAEGSGEVLTVPRVDAEGRPAGLGLVNTRKEPHGIDIFRQGTDLLTGERFGPTLTLEPLQVRVMAWEP